MLPVVGVVASIPQKYVHTLPTLPTVFKFTYLHMYISTTIKNVLTDTAANEQGRKNYALIQTFSKKSV